MELIICGCYLPRGRLCSICDYNAPHYREDKPYGHTYDDCYSPRPIDQVVVDEIADLGKLERLEKAIDLWDRHYEKEDRT